MTIDFSKLSPELRRGIEIFALKAKSGALSPYEKATSNEATMFSTLIRDALWDGRALERVEASLAVRNYIALNAKVDLLNTLLDAAEKFPNDSALDLLFATASIILETADATQQKAANACLTAFDSTNRRCFSLQEN
jgi:hypothetical protein